MTQPETITIPRPHIPFGPEHLTINTADAQYLHTAATELEQFHQPFGSNLRATVVKLIRDAARAIEDHVETSEDTISRDKES